MSETTTTTATNQLPERNPPTVIITTPYLCEIHGWELGKEHPVTASVIDNPDSNGFDIRVHSFKHNRSIWLAPGEYQLVNQ